VVLLLVNVDDGIRSAFTMAVASFNIYVGGGRAVLDRTSTRRGRAGGQARVALANSDGGESRFLDKGLVGATLGDSNA
jgi:hypothetical protein